MGAPVKFSSRYKPKNVLKPAEWLSVRIILYEAIFIFHWFLFDLFMMFKISLMFLSSFDVNSFSNFFLN